MKSFEAIVKAVNCCYKSLHLDFFIFIFILDCWSISFRTNFTSDLCILGNTRKIFKLVRHRQSLVSSIPSRNKTLVIPVKGYAKADIGVVVGVRFCLIFLISSKHFTQDCSSEVHTSERNRDFKEQLLKLKRLLLNSFFDIYYLHGTRLLNGLKLDLSHSGEIIISIMVSWIP